MIQVCSREAARTIVAAGVGVLLALPPGAAAKVPPCTGTFTVSSGATPQVLTVDISTRPPTIKYTNCLDGVGHVRGTPAGTKVTATFPSCNVLGPKVRLKATISPDCGSVMKFRLIPHKKPAVAGGGKGGGAPVSFSTTVGPMLASSCATPACHTGSNPSEGLTLDADKSYAALVGVPSLEQPSVKLVDPGKPKSSYLMMKLLGTAAQGAPMPLTGTPLSATQVQQISSWITQGAKSN